ncbi:metalloendoproteinase 1-like [Herrania umbratica]|uniref:Metalloendoproteinase 1-like n=1 Tax=Herrania umbratica TaxID=108875 RepID=A0A6J1BB65_9ROSI|nr:metalloendoproteinase 1-like [Herrania umbratica]
MAPKLSHQVFGAIFLFLVLQPFVVKSRPLEPETLRNLERAQNGDTLNGLSQVKKYLKAFGYYPNDLNLTDDHFDDSLESALKAYQQNYYLKVTGKIDHDTIKTMMIPRCGVPDIIPIRTSNGTGGTPHGVIFHLVANYSFFPGNPRWSRYQLTYNFLPGVQVVSPQVLRPIIAQAFQTWANVSPFRFQEVAQGNRADIRIGFYRYDHGDGYPFDGPGNILAHAFAPQDGRFHYDADENWSPNPTASNQIDLQSVAVHEIGHNLGLGHSQDQAAIMFPSLPAGATKRNLGQDDINGLRALYGY